MEVVEVCCRLLLDQCTRRDQQPGPHLVLFVAGTQETKFAQLVLQIFQLFAVSIARNWSMFSTRRWPPRAPLCALPPPLQLATLRT